MSIVEYLPDYVRTRQVNAYTLQNLKDVKSGDVGFLTYCRNNQPHSLCAHSSQGEWFSFRYVHPNMGTWMFVSKDCEFLFAVAPTGEILRIPRSYYYASDWRWVPIEEVLIKERERVI